MPRLTLTLALALALPAALAAQDPIDDGNPNVPDAQPAFPEQTEAPAMRSDLEFRVSAIAEGLNTAWAIAVLPGEAGYLVTLRGGTLHHISRDGTVSEPIAGVPEVRAQRQGGLLDVAIATDFADSRVIYLTYAKPLLFGRSATAAARAVLSEDMSMLRDLREIFEQSPPSLAPAHYGSRVTPMPDGTLTITTGDRFLGADEAQDPATHYGAVVRILPDGAPAPGNPDFGSPDAVPELYSHGHRNIQGAAIEPSTGALWTIEHGPAGGDELNRIEAGGNYGWPIVSYGENYNGSPVGEGRTAHAPEFIEPVYYWDPVIAPGGMEFYNAAMFSEWQGDILAAGLVAQAVVRLELSDGRVSGEERLAEGIGRVRDIAIDNDGAVLFLTDAANGALMRLSR